MQRRLSVKAHQYSVVSPRGGRQWHMRHCPFTGQQFFLQDGLCVRAFPPPNEKT